MVKSKYSRLVEPESNRKRKGSEKKGVKSAVDLWVENGRGKRGNGDGSIYSRGSR